MKILTLPGLWIKRISKYPLGNRGLPTNLLHFHRPEAWMVYVELDIRYIYLFPKTVQDKILSEPSWMSYLVYNDTSILRLQ